MASDRMFKLIVWLTVLVVATYAARHGLGHGLIVALVGFAAARARLLLAIPVSIGLAVAAVYAHVAFMVIGAIALLVAAVWGVGVIFLKWGVDAPETDGVNPMTSWDPL